MTLKTYYLYLESCDWNGHRNFAYDSLLLVDKLSEYFDDKFDAKQNDVHGLWAPCYSAVNSLFILPWCGAPKLCKKMFSLDTNIPLPCNIPCKHGYVRTIFACRI